MIQEEVNQKLNYMASQNRQGYNQGDNHDYHQGGNYNQNQGQSWKFHPKNNFNKD